MTDDDIRQQLHVVLDAQATNRAAIKSAADHFATGMKELWVAMQASELARDAGMLILNLLEERRDKKEDSPSKEGEATTGSEAGHLRQRMARPKPPR